METKKQITNGFITSGIPSHPPTHEGRTDPETTTASSANDDGIDIYDFSTTNRSSTMPRGQSGASVFMGAQQNQQNSISMAESAFSISPSHNNSSNNKNADNDTNNNVDGERADNEATILSSKKKRRRGKKRKDRSIQNVEVDEILPIKREFSSVKSKWKAAKHVIDATSDMLHRQQLKRSQSAPDEVGINSDHSKMAPCPSPSHVRGVLKKTGMIQPRTVWNPSPSSHHIEDGNDGSITLAQKNMQKEAMQLYKKKYESRKKKGG